MTTHHHEQVICECGHTGTVNWSENDQPYSKQWEQYGIEGFKGNGFYIEGYVSLDEALARIKPICPACGAVGKIKYAQRP